MKKYLSVFAAVLVQMALGGIYAYSIYVPSYQQLWGFSSAQTQIVFGVTVFLFTVFMIISGKKLVRYGPRRLIFISALLFSIGHIIVALSAGNFAVFTLGYWLFIAPSISFGYVCAVSTGMLWFPAHKGFVTGLAVAGYGAGGVLLSAVVERLFASGWQLTDVLLFVGVVWGAGIAIAGMLSFTPPGLLKKKSTYNVSKKIATYKKEFTALTLYLFAGTMPGLMMIGALKPFGLFYGVESAVAATAVAMLAVGNGTGRISWGVLADVVSPRKIVLINMIGIAVSMVLLYVASGSPALFVVASFVLGFCFGGPLVLAPNQIGLVFGTGNVSQVYPWALLFHGFAAAIGASIAGVIFVVTGSYVPVLVLGAVSAVVGATGYMVLTKKSSLT